MNDALSTVLMVVVLVVGFYFLAIRPQQKKNKEQAEMTASLQPGARIMTVHGIYGTVKHVGKKQAIIEIAPGIELTMVVGAISRHVFADEEEFEYADESEPDTVDEAAEEGEARPEEFVDDGPERFEDETEPPVQPAGTGQK